MIIAECGAHANLFGLGQTQTPAGKAGVGGTSELVRVFTC